MSSETSRDRRWLNQSAAADYLDVNPRTLRYWTAAGRIPAYRIKGSRLTRYDVADLDALLALIPTMDGVA